jgi:spore germination protein GerM
VRRIAVLTLALLALAGACRKQPPLTSNLAVENKVSVRQVRLYYQGPEMLLAAETRNVSLPENPAGALAVVMRELLKGSANTTVARSFPADTVLRGAYLLPDGTVFVDLGGPTLTQGWGTGSHEELMAVYSVVWTVTTNFAQARQVRLLVNGEPAETLAGHIALDRSLRPAEWVVDPRRR